MSTRKPYGERLVTNSGAGGFLCPPGHPMHTMSVQTGRRDNPNGIYSIDHAAKSEWLSPAMRGRCAGILKRWDREKLPLTDPAVQDWIAQVLGYFKGCYAGQDKAGNRSWNCSDLRITNEIDPMLNADLHAGVHCIREYYPEFTPTTEQFATCYWGRKPETAAA